MDKNKTLEVKGRCTECPMLFRSDGEEEIRAKFSCWILNKEIIVDSDEVHEDCPLKEGDFTLKLIPRKIILIDGLSIDQKCYLKTGRTTTRDPKEAKTFDSTEEAYAWASSVIVLYRPSWNYLDELIESTES